jgi:hypothetical protein
MRERWKKNGDDVRCTTNLKQRKTRKYDRHIELLGCLGVCHEGERLGEDGEREGEGDDG